MHKVGGYYFAVIHEEYRAERGHRRADYEFYDIYRNRLFVRDGFFFLFSVFVAFKHGGFRVFYVEEHKSDVDYD